MRDNKITIDEINTFVCRSIGIKAPIDPCKSLFHDYKIAGLDGFDLMEAFSSEFSVDIAGFDFERYFGAELPFNPIFYAFDMLRGVDRRKEVLPLSVHHLHEVALRGHWFEPNFAG